jgi:hypothetical protein
MKSISAKKATARVAGLWYLVVGVVAPIAMYMPGSLVVAGDATATMNNIARSETMFRGGIVASIVYLLAFILTVLALQRLFEDVDERLSRLMVAFVLVSVPIAFVNLLNPLAVLVLVSKASFLSGLSAGQIGSLVMMFLSLQDGGTALAEVFWGLWLLPLGMLAYKSGFIPRTIGVLLVMACFAYVAHALTWVLVPGAAGLANNLGMPFEIAGEVSLLLYLLVKGVRQRDAQAV